ncbi:MAG: CinA family protein [Chloroflexi bacterium]|nr:CinA family protein [Chloroflexota bacterium]
MTDRLQPARDPAEREARALAERVAAQLVKRRETLAIAESSTGGLVSHLLTNVPGSSAWFAGGLVAYSNAAKTDVAGVDPEIVRAGAVGEAAATALARGARTLFGVTWGVGETGIAGPQTGRRSSKPAGLVAVAVAGPDVTRALHLETGLTDREPNKWAFARAALRLLVESLDRVAGAPGQHS